MYRSERTKVVENRFLGPSAFSRVVLPHHFPNVLLCILVHNLVAPICLVLLALGRTQSLINLLHVNALSYHRSIWADFDIRFSICLIGTKPHCIECDPLPSILLGNFFTLLHLNLLLILTMLPPFSPSSKRRIV